jgi:putative endonuclease
MYYVYVIKSKIKNWKYIGFCSDLKERFSRHNSGKVISTKKYRPFELIYYEGFKNKNDAMVEEKFLKTGKGRERIKYLLKFTNK